MNGNWKLWRAQIAAIMRLEIRKSFLNRRGGVIYLLALMPVIIWAAPNPGMMTGPGTNSYLVGDADSGFIVIDPGPGRRRPRAAPF